MKPALFAAVSLVLVFRIASAQPAPAPASQPAVQHEANFDAERAQANQLYLAQKPLDALPLYEDLCRQDATIAVFAERHAAGLMAKMGTVAPAERNQIIVDAINELHRAQRLGDDSPYVQSVLGILSKTPMGLVVMASQGGLPLTVGWTYGGNAEAQVSMRQAESYFSHGDAAKALTSYIAAAASDAKWYSAALYAGDAYFRLKDYANASLWYAKAVAIDPDRETAYRYWGDNLLAAGDTTGAKVKFEQAFIAEPYSGSALAGLRTYAIKMRISLVQTYMARPGFLNWNGKPEEDLTHDSGNGHSEWAVYRSARQAHGKEVVFNQWVMRGAVPDAITFSFAPQGYVHTLAEEKEAIEAMLADTRQKLTSGTLVQESLEPGLKNLLGLQKANMLEPFILFDFNDAGIRHGYPEYRSAHRDQLIAYVDKYWFAPLLPTDHPDRYIDLSH